MQDPVVTAGVEEVLLGQMLSPQFRRLEAQVTRMSVVSAMEMHDPKAAEDGMANLRISETNGYTTTAILATCFVFHYQGRAVWLKLLG
jgi:hypothetical protein